MSLDSTQAITLTPIAEPTITVRIPPPQTIHIPASKPARESSIVWPILTTSAALHLLLVGLLGAGVPKAAAAKTRKPELPPTSVEMVENIRIDPVPDTPPPENTQPDNLSPEAPPASAPDVALPQLASVEPIAAVSANVPVAFGIAVKGPVRLVSDPAFASGRVGGKAAPVPIALDEDQAKQNLLTAPLTYPPLAAVKHQAGTVVVEFKTSPTGDILDAKIRESSGYPLLDSAALANLKAGRWTGTAGYYQKAYLFKLN